MQHKYPLKYHKYKMILCNKYYIKISSVMNRTNPKPTQTNPRYERFTQSIYHAGDEEQFRKLYDEKVEDFNRGEQKVIDLSENPYANVDLRSDLDMYKNIDALQTINTFNYIFTKFKKGIFVRIIGGKLSTFLPFSNANYVNEWSHKIEIDPVYGDITGFVNYIHSLEGRRFYPNSVNKNISEWCANNHLLRMEYPIVEGDTNISEVKDMFSELCSSMEIPDCEFFVNRRDFPLLCKNRTEPYNNIWGENQPLVSYCLDKYTPIFSMCGKDIHADVLIPTHDDWKSSSCTDTYTTSWEMKKPTAVFRGSSTGQGVFIDDNIRLKLAYISHITSNKDVLDAGITKWNLRPKKLHSYRYLQTTNIKELPFGLVEPLTPDEQSKYKYIVCVDGHVSAFRMSREMMYGSVLLVAQSEWNMWYKKFMIEYVHYVPIKGDLSDLLDKIEWCKNNDVKCEEISENLLEFHKQYLSKNSILRFLQKKIIDIKTETGGFTYPNNPFFSNQAEKEFDEVKKLSIPRVQINGDCTWPLKRNIGYLSAIGLRTKVYLSGQSGGLSNIKEKSLLFGRDESHPRGPTASTLHVSVCDGYDMLVKKQVKVSSRSEILHELYIGMVCINKLMEEIPPNFSYTFGYYLRGDKFNIVKEYIKGPTLQEFISSHEFTVEKFVMICSQISLALYASQIRYGFVHQDLMPWNIILTKSDCDTDFVYPVSDISMVKLPIKRGDYIPVITDYGKSHVIVDNIHYGKINPFSTSYKSDVYTLFITSIKEILNRRTLTGVDYILFLARRYFNVEFRDHESLRYFANRESKYATLIKKNLHNSGETAYDLFKLLRAFSENLGEFVDGTGDIVKNTDYIPGHVLKFHTSKSQEEKIQTFIDRLSYTNQQVSSVIDFPSWVYSYYFCQKVEKTVNILVAGLDRFCKFVNVEVPCKAIKIAKIIINKLDSIIKSVKLDDKSEFVDQKISIGIFVCSTMYTEDILLSQSTVNSLKLESEKSKISSNILSERMLVSKVLFCKGRYEVPQIYRECSYSVAVLNQNPIDILRASVNINTILEM
jgi:serine/threonine protein kinase